MAKLIELKEAAERLGVTPEELTEMRSRNEIFGYRDGASWKFKPEEIERVANELGVSSASASATDDIGGLASDVVADGDDELIDVAELQLDDDSQDDNDSILVTEEELGRSDDSTSSTIIGKTGLETPASESDIKLAEDLALGEGSDLGLAEGGSDLSLADDSDIGAGGPGSSVTSASDVLAGDSDLLSVDEGGTGSGVDLSLEGSGVDVSADSSLKLAGSDAISIGDDELSLEGDSALGSGIGAVDSSIDLDLDDDDLMPGSGTGSDVTLGASDSGINLTNPSDSGISLEDVPSDLGSGIDSSLELGDEDLIQLDGDAADPEEATELQTDEEFVLTPVAAEGELDEESDDSGSQVIALDEEEMDESAATMLVADEDALVGGDLTAAGAATKPAAQGVGAVEAAESPFGVWDMVMLSSLSLFMGLCGLLALDLIRNIWSWGRPYQLNSTIMDFIVGML